MVLKKSANYGRDCKRIVNQHKQVILEKINKIETILILHTSFDDLMHSPFYNVYRFEMLRGDMQGIYSVVLDGKTRMFLRPIGDETYQYKEIHEVELIGINQKHYKK